MLIIFSHVSSHCQVAGESVSRENLQVSCLEGVYSCEVSCSLELNSSRLSLGMLSNAKVPTLWRFFFFFLLIPVSCGI